MTINQKNAKIAAELGIPRLAFNKQQRGYYQTHLRRCIQYLEWVLIANVVLIMVILYLFFTRSSELCYATSFNGENTFIQNYSLTQASLITQQNKLQEGSDS